MTISIIGSGRVGDALAKRSSDRNIDVLLIDRHRGWGQLSETPGQPILVATRNDDLDGVVERLAESRRMDLVCIQNGMLRPWLDAKGLREITRGLLFFAVPKRGAPIESGPASPFYGPHATAIVTWLRALDLPAEAVSEEDFKKLELEKLIWNAAFGLLCQRLSADVGTVATQHRDLLQGLVQELLRVGEGNLGVRLSVEPLLQRLIDYSLSIPEYRGAVKEWSWRNGWFVDAATACNLPTPLHLTLLSEIDAKIDAKI